MKQKTVIIIGAGAAGLNAARTLQADFHVIILEATARVGGRILSVLSPHSPIPLELGAEFIHGQLPETFRLAAEAGLSPVRFEGKMKRKEEGGWRTQDDMIEGWDELMKRMKSLKTDQPLTGFLDIYFPAPEFNELREQVISFAEGFDIADATEVSTIALYQEWEEQDEDNFRIREGYGALMTFLAEQADTCEFHFEDPVRQVDWQSGEITVYTESGRKYQAHRLLITIPLGPLQLALGSHSINFTPELDHYIKAAQDLGMGQVIRFVFRFRRPLWEAGTGFIFSQEPIPTWWPGVDPAESVLVGWVGGRNAEKLKERTEEELMSLAKDSLAAIFDLDSQSLEALIIEASVMNWSAHQPTLGGYAYHKPASKLALDLLNTPVDQTIWFSGEALYRGPHPGTVEAALVHGRRTAEAIQRSL